MSDFDIGFFLFYVFVGVMLVPIAYRLDKRKEEKAIKRAKEWNTLVDIIRETYPVERFHQTQNYELKITHDSKPVRESREFNVPCDYLLNPAVLEKKGEE